MFKQVALIVTDPDKQGTTDNKIPDRPPKHNFIK